MLSKNNEMQNHMTPPKMCVKMQIRKVCRYYKDGRRRYWMIHYYLSKNPDRWFSPGSPVSSTNKTDRHDTGIAEILLKVPLSTHNPNPIVNGTQSQDGNIFRSGFLLR
jgi:hypothetical protein